MFIELKNGGGNSLMTLPF